MVDEFQVQTGELRGKGLGWETNRRMVAARNIMGALLGAVCIRP